MISRAARLLALPAGITLLSSLSPTPPQWAVRPLVPEPVRQVVAPVRPTKQELPRIVAIDQRIAKRVNALRPSVKQRLVAALNRLPKKVTLLVTSASRTRAEQAALRPTFGIKARPGRSTHEDGRAVDVNVLVDGKRVSPRMNEKIIGPVMASVGFRALGRIDPVHYSVPKEHIDATLTEGPLLQPMTYDEYRALEAFNAELEQNPDAAAPGSAPVAPVSPAASAFTYTTVGLTE